MVWMLIFYARWRQEYGWADAPNYPGEFDGVGGAQFEVAVAACVEFDEFDGGSEDFGGSSCLGTAQLGCAVGGSFTSGRNYEMRFSSRACLRSDDRATSEFDVVGVSTEGKQRLS